MSEQVAVSVVIPAYNEENSLGNCLHSLAAQNTRHSFEVIVVDNNSTDKTPIVAEGFSSLLKLRVVREPRQGRGAARARGFGEAAGEIILSTDADTTVPPHWVESLVENLVKSESGIVTGVTTVTGLASRPTKFFDWFYPKYHLFYRCLLGHYCPVGFNFAIRKEIYHQSGGFNSDLKAMEDVDLGFRLRKIGKIKFLPEVAVNFSGRRFERGVIKGFYEYFIEFIRYYRSGKTRADLQDIR